jgi:Protein of unknown function (DUF1616)
LSDPSEQADSTTRSILRLIKEKNPKDVKQLVILMEERLNLKEEQALDKIVKLQNQGAIRFETQSLPASTNLAAFLKTRQTTWYWATIASAILTLAVIFMIPANLQPWSYLRNILGTVFVLCLPGYAFIKALFPVDMPIKTSSENLALVERFVLSLGMSLVLVPLTALILNYTPWGIGIGPLALSIFALTLVLATAGLVRDFQAKKKAQV